MSRYYALTINTRSNRNPPNAFSYNKACDKYELKYGVQIFPRYFEIAPKTKKLHVHCLVTQDLKNDKIEKFIGQKNHNIDFELCMNKAAWLNYIGKDQKLEKPKQKNLFNRSKDSNVMRETEGGPVTYINADAILPNNCKYPNFDIRKL